MRFNQGSPVGMGSKFALIAAMAAAVVIASAAVAQQQAPSPDQAPTVLSTLDADGDGKISESEAPGGLKQNFASVDRNGDGGIDLEELTTVLEAAASRRGGGPGEAPAATSARASGAPDSVPSALDSQESVKAAHENLEEGARTDDLGIFVPIPASHPGRRYPADHEFPTGPEIGERLPEFSLPNQKGDVVDFHADRDDSKAIVVFYRSAVW